MKIRIIMLGDKDEQSGTMFEISDLTQFVANAVFDSLYNLCINSEK